MAGIAFEIATENGAFEVKDVISFELSKNDDAACDGLRLKFSTGKRPDEIITVTAFIGGKKVFFGYCDTQRIERKTNGYEVFIYARSSACILVDNEAEPNTYNAPSAKAIFINEAERFGFKNGIDELYCKYSYTVPKGSSCFGAINDFVRVLCGKSIAVSPDNVLYIPKSDSVIKIDKDDIISLTQIINRGAPVSQISYKLEGDEGYIRHFDSRSMLDKGVSKSRKINISALPAWQREYTLKKRLYAAAHSYRQAKIDLRGVHFLNLFDRVECDSEVGENLDGYEVRGLCIAQNDTTAYTRLLLEKPVELKEVNYVAK